MEHTMEPDELKTAWQALGRQLERNDAIQLQLIRDGKLGRARSNLRPLFWGQLAKYDRALALCAGV